MSFFICQACGTEYEAEQPKCPACGRTETIRLNRGDRLVDKVINGRFKILKKIGQGGMGAVYLAEQVGIGHRVAIKFLKQEYSTDIEVARRFLNEAKTYAKVAHPNAVTFHEFGQDDEGNLFIAMEYCEGVDLKRTIAERGRLPVVEAVEVIVQVADVLAEAHQKRIVHRDLKPENIMIRKGLRGMHAKVLDFGIARLMDASTQLTVAGAIAGTPRYMSPEQVEGKEVDARADIYSLGIVCFEALTGKQPFDGSTIAEIMRKQVMDPLPRLGAFAQELDLPALQSTLDRACAKRREDRFGDMIAFATALSQAIPTQLQLSLPPVQRLATESSRQGVARNATPASLRTDATSPGSPDDPSTISSSTGGVGAIDPGREGNAAVGGEKSRLSLIVAGLGVAAVAGVLTLWGLTKDERETATSLPESITPVEPVVIKDPIPTAGLSADPNVIVTESVRVIHEQMAVEKLKAARTSWDKGDLETARIDLNGVDSDTLARADAEKLLKDLKALQESLAVGDAARMRGDCASAVRAYRAAEKINPNVGAVKAGISRCQAAAIPDQAE